MPRGKRRALAPISGPIVPLQERRKVPDEIHAALDEYESRSHDAAKSNTWLATTRYDQARKNLFELIELWANR